MRFFVKLKYQANTKILSVGIKYSVRDLLLTSVTIRDPQTSDMRHIRPFTWMSYLFIYVSYLCKISISVLYLFF